MLEYIYICRHGFRSNFVDPTITTGPTKMPRDPPLAAYGHEQAEQLADFLSSPSALAPHPVPQKVFTSPFYRCIETSLPTARALRLCPGKDEVLEDGKEYEGVRLEHGVQEWYPHVNPNTGLHPRPASPDVMSTFFPQMINTDYTSTVYSDRGGEYLKEIQDRTDLFAEVWPARVEAEMPGVRSVVIFSHAAAVISLGRSFTGDKELEVPAGCCSCSLYRRKTRASTASEPEEHGPSKDEACGVGEWEPVFLGRADFLPMGVERNWDFGHAAIFEGEVVNEDGDHRPHPPQDTIPTGLAPGMEKYLRRGMPPKNKSTKEIRAALAADRARKGKM